MYNMVYHIHASHRIQFRYLVLWHFYVNLYRCCKLYKSVPIGNAYKKLLKCVHIKIGKCAKQLYRNIYEMWLFIFLWITCGSVDWGETINKSISAAVRWNLKMKHKFLLVSFHRKNRKLIIRCGFDVRAWRFFFL